MRKRQKQDILEILQSLYEANREIEAALKNKQPELARNMLCDCQECAIELGNVIDQAEGEGTEAVSYLEKYCEVLFHYHQKLSEMEQLDKKAVEKIKKALDKQIREIENSIRNNIPERQEIVFMPYKASMWDSLESVYLAAKEDPDCDAYCVPIPYFDKNPDGSLGQMHYEIDQYPKNIEVVNRLNYKLEERRPDVIYIHNPYDECNHVTCVHPDYFSSRLKQYTDKLVYIPYFVLQEIEPDDEKSIEQMRHFCFLPGTINADRVIVQSEKMRQIYINEYLKAAKVYGLTGEHLDRAKLEEKFLGLGSPKFDKVVNTRKEDMDVPSEWLKVIEKEDGSWKKIILYNTSINALLKYGEQMFVKMKSVFETFKERQKEVTLLWRPHPLIPSTIQSMRPQLWEKYKEIVEQYKEEGWGIYDDSSDLDRAVEISNMYYGDISSVGSLYEKTGKKVYIQNIYYSSYGTEAIVGTEAITTVDNTFYFVPRVGKSLYKMSGDFKSIVCLKEIYEERERGLYIGIVFYNGCLFLIPKTAKKIAIYNIKTESIEYVDFRNGKKEDYSNSTFFDYHVDGKYLFLIPNKYPNLLIMDMSTRKIKQIKLAADNYRICTGKSAFFNKKIFIPCECDNTIIECNTNNFQIRKHNIKKFNKHRFIFAFNNKLCIIPQNIQGEILVWNIEDNRIRTIEIDVEINKESEFVRGIIFKEKIFLISTNQKHNIMINLQTEKIETWSIPENNTPENSEKWISNLSQLLLFEYQEKLYLINGLTCEWFIYEKNLWKRVNLSKQDKDNRPVILDGRIITVSDDTNQLITEKESGENIHIQVKNI